MPVSGHLLHQVPKKFSFLIFHPFFLLSLPFLVYPCLLLWGQHLFTKACFTIHLLPCCRTTKHTPPCWKNTQQTHYSQEIMLKQRIQTPFACLPLSLWSTLESIPPEMLNTRWSEHLQLLLLPPPRRISDSEFQVPVVEPPVSYSSTNHTTSGKFAPTRAP